MGVVHQLGSEAVLGGFLRVVRGRSALGHAAMLIVAMNFGFCTVWRIDFSSD